MRAIWSGEISFGLVNIPTKLYSATKDLTPHFHQLHIECGSRINMVRRCAKCARDVEWGEIGKGYEVSKGEYALFTKEELKELEGDDTGGIDIVAFIEQSEVDLTYIGKSYWVGPGGKSTRGFALLHKALVETGRAALAKVRLRSKTQLGLLRPKEKFFSLDTMRFADELVSSESIDLPDTKGSTDKELGLAIEMIQRLSAPFDPAVLPDEYRAAIEAAVQEKVDAKELKVSDDPKDEGEGGKVIDLAELLATSLKGIAKPGVKNTREGDEPAQATKKSKRKTG